MKTKSILALMLGLLLVLGACNEKQEPIKDNPQNGKEDIPSFEGDKGTVGGYNWVNLGLPSGTLWATEHVGATPYYEDRVFSGYEGYNRYRWGDTVGYGSGAWEFYEYGSSNNELTKYCNDSRYGKDGFTDDKTVLDAEDDAATVNGGKYWRMPTKEEFEELMSECRYEWVFDGLEFTGPNGNTLIFSDGYGYTDENNRNRPYTRGVHFSYFWSSSLSSNSPDDAYVFVCYRSAEDGYEDFFINVLPRCCACPIRPVVKR